MSLVGRTCVVLGGTSGIGRGLAGAFAADGARVVVWSRSAGGDAAPQGTVTTGVACDVRDQHSVDAAVTTTLATVGEIDVFVGCAGVNDVHPFIGTPWDDVRATFDVNLTGTVRATTAVARRMVARGSGRIVLVSSIAGLRGQSRTSDYAASKAALSAWAGVAAVELAPHGVQLVTLTPGYVHTPLLDRYTADPRFTATVEARVPAGRIGRPHDLVGWALAAGAGAVPHAIGADLVVDGGYTCA